MTRPISAFLALAALLLVGCQTTSPYPGSASKKKLSWPSSLPSESRTASYNTSTIHNTSSYRRGATRGSTTSMQSAVGGPGNTTIIVQDPYPVYVPYGYQRPHYYGGHPHTGNLPARTRFGSSTYNITPPAGTPAPKKTPPKFYYPNLGQTKANIE